MGWTEDIPLLRAQLADVQRDLRLWLAVHQSEQERLYVRRMAEHLGDFERLLDRIEIRRIKLCDAPEEQRRGEECVRGFLDAFQCARKLQGSVIGTHLTPLATYLSNQPEQLKGSSTDTRAEQPQKETPSGVEQAAVLGAESKLEDRRAMVNAYIAEVLDKTGKRITRKDIWRKAGYNSRTEFERWERKDAARPNRAAAEAFNRILREKPHLK